jgi:hypothetical protein
VRKPEEPNTRRNRQGNTNHLHHFGLLRTRDAKASGDKQVGDGPKKRRTSIGMKTGASSSALSIQVLIYISRLLPKPAYSVVLSRSVVTGGRTIANDPGLRPLLSGIASEA